MVIYGYFRILRILPSFRRTQTSPKKQTYLPTGPPAMRVVRGPFLRHRADISCDIVNLWRAAININELLSPVVV